MSLNLFTIHRKHKTQPPAQKWRFLLSENIDKIIKKCIINTIIEKRGGFKIRHKEKKWREKENTSRKAGQDL
jgi:hypothetical protein